MRLREYLSQPEYLSEDKEALLKKIEQIRKAHGTLETYERDKASTFGKFTISGDEVVFNSKVLNIDRRFLEDGEISIPFASAPAVCLYDSCLETLKSFKNLPRELRGEGGLQQAAFFTAVKNAEGGDYIQNYEGFPEKIQGDVYLQNNKLAKISMTHFNHYVKELNGCIIISQKYNGPLLSTLLVKGLTMVYSYEAKFDDIMKRCFKIKGEILDAKELLMTNGYKEYAKL